MAVDKETEELKLELLQKRRKETPLSNKDLLSSGSTLLNLQCSGKPTGCFAKGTYNHFVGDSDSGKTFFCLTSFAEACISASFKEHRLIYYPIESGGALMDFGAYFGSSVAKKVERREGIVTAEQFFYDLDTVHSDGQPYIAILDSEDALSTEDEQDKFAEEKEAHEKGKEVTGSYGTSKAKENSARLRVASARLKDFGSILTIISQTRDNIGFGSMFNPKVYSGGHALKFYATLQIWSKVKGELKTSYKGKDRQLGIMSQVKVTKNHLTGKKGSVEVPIYHSFGIDDLGSCVNYLLEEGHWGKAKSEKTEAKMGKKKGGGIAAPEFDFVGSEEKLIQKIEEEGKEKELRDLTAKVWDDIASACVVTRKSRYH